MSLSPSTSSNLLKAFWVNLKACLGLVLPNQYCLIVVREIEVGFLGDVISWATPTPLWSLLYSTIILYDRVYQSSLFHMFSISLANTIITF